MVGKVVQYKITSIAVLKFYITKYGGGNPEFLPNSGSKWNINLCFPYVNYHLFLGIHGQFGGKFRDNDVKAPFKIEISVSPNSNKYLFTESKQHPRYSLCSKERFII